MRPDPFQSLDRAPSAPAVLRRAGKNALFAADEFFAARISNPHTRRAYARFVGRFLAWCEEQGIELRQVTPGLAGRFIEEIPGSDPTKNLALAALRHFFDALVIRHAVALNPFSSVRGRKHAVVDGKTPQLAIQQARDLLASIDLSHVIGLRDRALLGTLAYTGARVGALARLRRGGPRGPGRPARPAVPGKGRPAARDPRPPRPRSLASRRTCRRPGSTPIPRRRPCSGRPWENRRSSPGTPCRPTPCAAWLKRRLKDARLPDIFSPHSFRVLVVTDLLTQDVPLEDVQYLAGHANPKTTQIYDRRQKRVTRNIVERISRVRSSDRGG